MSPPSGVSFDARRSCRPTRSGLAIVSALLLLTSPTLLAAPGGGKGRPGGGGGEGGEPPPADHDTVTTILGAGYDMNDAGQILVWGYRQKANGGRFMVMEPDGNW